ncbi:FecR family protein [Maribacter sp. 2307ULW6-5]|uniref:FecR family protein n=1 Tax=Maribacter sp. 2307ULW6-5 TaxID=3386275 RepID=UPI0039BC904B
MDKEKLIQKWLNNELTADEQAAFDAMEDAPFLTEISQEAKRFGPKHSTPSFESLEKRLAHKTVKKTNWSKLLPRIAAIFIIGLGLFYLMNSNSGLTTTTQWAENTNLTLPDNSKVALNEASTLTYDPDSWATKRELSLEGEAFFEVEKGQRFEVRTSYGTVSVLGTEFNVTARDGIFQVVCYEGLVAVSLNGNTTELPAGSALVLKNGKIEEQDVALRKPQWLNGMSVFENAALTTVLAELEKQYNISVSTNNVDHLRFTGAFEHNNLENALTAITQTLGLQYTIKGDNVTIGHGAP